MNDVVAVIAALGGNASFGRLIGKGASTASEMKRRGSIPVCYWPQIVTEARARDISWLTYEALVTIHARPAGWNKAVSGLTTAAESIDEV